MAKAYFALFPVFPTDSLVKANLGREDSSRASMVTDMGASRIEHEAADCLGGSRTGLLLSY